MLVRLNIGRKAGQIQDIEISAARAMIADGRAAEVRYESSEESEGVAQLQEAAKSAKPADLAKKKK